MQQLSKKEFSSLFTLLVKAAYKFTKDEAIAEDIVQDVFLKVLQKNKTTPLRAKLSTYLYRAVVNESIDYLRKNNKVIKVSIQPIHLSLFENNDPNENHLELMEIKVKLAIAELPKKCREIFIMSKIQGLKYQEIANELGISIKTVENQMGKAYKMLRNKLKNDSVNDYKFTLLTLIIGGLEPFFV